MHISIVNGPNLNLLGEREPEVYGIETLTQINHWISELIEVKTHQLSFFQSNHEGVIIDHLQASRKHSDAVILNAGALTHYSYALRDAISSCQLPTVEVHLSDIHQREDFRKISVIKDVCLCQISGHGKEGYAMAVRYLLKHT